MIRSSAALQPVLDAIAGARRVAVDTEFHSERHFYPRLMLIQIRVDEGPAWLVDPLADLDLAPLGAALSRVPLLLHGGVMDLQILHREIGMRPCSVFDTQIAAGCAGDGFPIRLQELVRRHLDLRIPKAETLSDWSQRPLSADQLHYAADDVLLLGPLADALTARLEAMGTTAIAEACTAEHVERALAAEDHSTAWRVVPGNQLLDDTERAVLQALAAWRDRTAQERDVARSNVVSDAMLLDIARRQPGTFESLRANRRMPSQIWKRDGAAVLACVAAGRVAPPPPAPASRGRLWRELVGAAARTAEAERGVAPELVLTDATLDRLADNRAIEPWRESALGPSFRAFIEGRRGIVLPGRWTDDNL
ncbi:MAG: HRDC domain-containing protein [Pseudomonadota bacterium]|nr:HRDC domain-containing protein [Pseudomonadota bacterium]